MPKRGAECQAPHCCDCEVKRRRRLVIFSDSSDSEEENTETQTGQEAEATPSGDAAPAEAASGESNEDSPVLANTSDLTDTPQDATVNVDPPPTAEIPDLDPEILEALGAKTDDEPEYGEKIHDNLSQLWTPLLKKGMSKEDKEKIVKKYSVPDNCKLLQAPKLNLEISAAISESARGRDKKIKDGQQQLGHGITAINRAIDILLSKQENSTVNAIKHLSDACRILCDLHHMESLARIKLITPTLDKSFLNVIQDCPRDEMLFGNKLADKIKSSKTIEKQGLQIKKVAPTAASTSSSRPAQPRGNWTGPPRYTSNRGGRGSAKKPFTPRRPLPPPAAQTSAAKTSKPQTRAQTHH